MSLKQLIPIQKSYFVAGIATLFVMGLLIISISLTTSIEENSLKLSTAYTVDPYAVPTNDSLTIQNIWSLAEQDWQPLIKANLGLSNSPHWFRIQPERLQVGEHYLLEINYGLLDQIDVWVFSNAGRQSLSPTETHTFITGDGQPFNFRPIEHEQFLFSIQAESTDLIIFLRVKSAGPVKVPIRLWQANDFVEYSGSHKLFMGLFFGYMLAMALFNLFIYATTHKLPFAIYTGYVISLALVVATLHGIGFRYFWPDNVWFQERAIAFFACTTLTLIIIFSIQVLELKSTSPLAYRLLRAFKWVFVFLMAMVFVMPYTIVLKSVLIMTAMTSPMIMIASLILAVKGKVIARYFVGAWAALFIAGVGLTSENLGWNELPMDASYLLMVAAITETLLLALALAIGFNTQYRDAASARALARKNQEQAIAAKDELLKLQEESQQALEYNVQERTLELEIAMRELSDANQELERLSAIDALTGLMNRRYFDKRLLAEARRSRREQRHLSLAVLDIDYFKKVNDNFGHLAGDECLKGFAKTLQASIQRPSDIICRYGGEEFVVILPGTELEGAIQLMEKVRLAVADSVTEFEGKQLKMTVSIGVTSKIIASDDEQALVLAFADKLLYKAKNAGRNKVVAEPYSDVAT